MAPRDTVLTSRLDDEGDYFELVISKGGKSFGAFLVDIEPLGVDAALALVAQVQALVFNSLGDGGGSAPYRPQQQDSC